MSFIASLFFGMLPEVLFFTIFLIFTKNLKEKRIKLFIMISIVYVLCIMISRFKLIYYIAFIFLVYIILKLLYKNKTQIIDIFVFSLATLYLTISSYICYELMVKGIIKSSFICYLLSRINLLFPFIFKSKFNKLYCNYCKLWNRNDKIKRPIKSITLRNISLICINAFIFFMNICALIKTGCFN
jgi:hypothetical protein